VDPPGHDDPETAVVQRDTVTAVFGELRGRERQALWQWAVERRPLAEIATELGISYTAVQQLLFRARRHALLVAARVAALLGLFHLGRALRRASQAGQLVLVAVVVPVVLSSVPASSATHRTAAPPPPHASTRILPPTMRERVGTILPPTMRQRVGVGGIEVSSLPLTLPATVGVGGIQPGLVLPSLPHPLERIPPHLAGRARLVDAGDALALLP
jgi:hypothetical protein